MLSHDFSVINVSLDGMAFRTTKRLQLNRAYTFRIPFDGEEIALQGGVKWCRLAGSVPAGKGEAAPVYEVGVRFTGGTEEQALSYGRFVKCHQKKSTAVSAVKVSLTHAPGTPLELTFPGDYPVAKLSPEEAIIETDMELPEGTRLRCDFCLPEDVHIFPTGHVTSCDRRKEGVYCLRIEIKDLPPADKERLRSFGGK